MGIYDEIHVSNVSLELIQASGLDRCGLDNASAEAKPHSSPQF